MRILALPLAATATVVVLSGCFDGSTEPATTSQPASPSRTSETRPLTSAKVTLEVGHCWVEPISFDGASWNLPIAKQIGWGGRLPADWQGTGVITRLTENRVRYVDAGGAVLTLFPANAPGVSLKHKLCA